MSVSEFQAVMQQKAKFMEHSKWRLSMATLTSLIAVLASDANAVEPVAKWSFRDDSSLWITNSMIMASPPGIEGWFMKVESPDPFLTSPRFDGPSDGCMQVTLRMCSTAGPMAQIYFGSRFTESHSCHFTVKNDGEWHTYRVILPPLGSGVRLRLDPCTTDGTITLDWMRVDALSALPSESWARPEELWNKKAIGGGLYTTYGEETAITPQYLAQHPEFADNYPFDGIVLPAQLSPEWVAGLGLTKYGQLLRPAFLHELIWTKIAIPDDAVAQTIADLKLIQRGSMTDNFMIYGMVDGARGLQTPDLASDEDWTILQRNAALAARICREGRLKGMWMDTEQYGHYRWRTQSGSPEFDPDKPQGLHFPLGKDSPDVLRKRGTQWIRAVQAEFPEVKIMTTFAWSPDAGSYGPLTGVIPFLDGVLEGITAPGEIIHGHENTFYFGQAAGTTHTYATPNGFPGDRQRYESARTDIRNWRALSSDPDKYDTFVKTGMAAWVEDHPWNTPAGWPDGSKASFWSNLPLALAYSDEYVWVWSEHTKYGQQDKQELNPFLASLNNRTLNKGDQRIAEFSEDFVTDPMRRDWTFDFDMLHISGKRDPTHEAALMSVDTQPYRRETSSKSLLISDISHSPQGNIGQRRRYVRPVANITQATSFRFSMDLVIERLDALALSPVTIGLFNSESPVEHQSVAFRIRGPHEVDVVVSRGSSELTIPLSISEPLLIEKTYRAVVSYDASTRVLRTKMEPLSNASELAPESEGSWAEAVLPDAFGSLQLDEAGIAFMELADTAPTGSNVTLFRIEKIELHR